MPFAPPPISIRLNRSFFPADLITVQTRRQNRLDGFQIEQAVTDDTFKAHDGGGGGESYFGPGSSVDIFVRDESPGGTYLIPLERSLYLPVRRGWPGVLHISWQKVNGKDLPGEICLIWTHEDRIRDRAPFLAVGSSAKTLWDYSRGSDPITGNLLRIGRRVPRMRLQDIDRRVRNEKKRVADQMDAIHHERAQSISVQGFRGFREPAILTLAQPNGKEGSGLTFVVGANNTGKSTIWESFDAIARKLKSGVSFSEGRRNRRTEGGIRIGLTRVDGSSYIVKSIDGGTSETQAEWLPAGQPHRSPEIVSVPSRRQFQASFGRGGNAQRDWMTMGAEFTRIRQTDQFTGRLFDLHNDRERKARFDELMTEVLGEPLKWTIDLGDGAYGQSYYLKVMTGEGVNHTSEGLGDGIISLLFILDALYDSDTSTLLVLDEPELSLHPELVRRLGRVLARFAKDRQIVVFTHSPKLVSWEDMEAGAEIARVYKEGADSRIAQASRATMEGLPKARGGWRNPHSLGLDAKEALFLDDRIIVVEGQEDAGLLPRAFELAGVEMVGTIFGWGSGGADNIGRIVSLLKELGFKRVAAVLDNNKPDAARAIREAHPGVLVAEIPAADIRDKSGKDHPVVRGLLSEDGKVMKDDLKDLAKEVFGNVAIFLSTGQLPREDHDLSSTDD